MSSFTQIKQAARLNELEELEKAVDMYYVVKEYISTVVDDKIYFGKFRNALKAIGINNCKEHLIIPVTLDEGKLTLVYGGTKKETNKILKSIQKETELIKAKKQDNLGIILSKIPWDNDVEKKQKSKKTEAKKKSTSYAVPNRLSSPKDNL